MISQEYSEQEIRTQLVQELNKLNEEKLIILRQFISRLIADDLIESVTTDWETGRVNHEAIQRSIEEHRAQHPYRKGDQ